MLPHSWLFGHLRILFDWRGSNPSDISFYLFHTWVAQNACKYSPEFNGKTPGVLYLDFWPLTYSYALVVDGEAGAQFTVTPSLDKHPVVADYLVMMTHGHDLFSSNGQFWKTWRTRLNPGFSARHMSTLMPELLEEVTTCVDILKSRAGSNGTWGPVFQLEPTAINLTFDVITRTIL
jgi:cytochrome P450